ncbi:MAG: GGDEF domain-containing protein [Candidatus Methanomethylicia archaeon]
MKDIADLNATSTSNFSINSAINLTNFFLKVEEIENSKNVKEFISITLKSIVDLLHVDFIIFDNLLKFHDNFRYKTDKNLKIKLSNLRYKLISKDNKNRSFYLKLNTNTQIIYVFGEIVLFDKKKIPFIIGQSDKPLDFEQFILFKNLTKFITMKINKFLEREHLKNIFFIDMLTGLYNRNFLNTSIGIEIENLKRYKYTLTALMLDVDNFKNINDNYGHLEGDRILKLIGETIKKNIRKSDIAIRYGGDEFLIFLKKTTSTDAYHIAKKIREKIKELTINDHNISMSIGIAQVTEKDDINSIINKVDKFLYIAKREGKNKIKMEGNLQ